MSVVSVLSAGGKLEFNTDILPAFDSLYEPMKLFLRGVGSLIFAPNEQTTFAPMTFVSCGHVERFIFFHH